MTLLRITIRVSREHMRCSFVLPVSGVMSIASCAVVVADLLRVLRVVLAAAASGAALQ